AKIPIKIISERFTIFYPYVYVTDVLLIFHYKNLSTVIIKLQIKFIGFYITPQPTQLRFNSG
ncbi:hypothetical protein ACFLSS_04715, partial [Bacteroidota bacterium]